MRFSARILDDLLLKVFAKLLSSGGAVSASRGNNHELTGVLLELRNPRARLSRTETRGKPFSCLGEFLWYMSGSNRLDFIRYYIQKYEHESEDGETIHGAYGPRFFQQRGHDQLQNVVDLLRQRPGSRRAVVQLFNAEDLARHYKEVPCTCTLQFFARGKRLHLITTLRSNDAYKGLPHDIFCFTMLQEIVARSLGLELGTYKQFVGSLHLYDEDREAAERYLGEGVQATVVMPAMPRGDPRPPLNTLLRAEHQIRNGLRLDPEVWTVKPYWADLIRLLQIFAASGDPTKIDEIRSRMAYEKYSPYIATRKVMRPPVPQPSRQLTLRI